MSSSSRNLLIVSLAVGHCAGASAQVVVDGSLGPAGAIVADGAGDHSILAAHGRLVPGAAGDHLFHSFQQLDLETGQSATFSGPARVVNIIGRITGGAASRIDGTLASTIDGADLYLLNPAGVVFGNGAALDLDGSLHVSTGDYLSLADGVRFDARPSPGDALLSAAVPAAFGFSSGRVPAGIEVREGASLRVGSGHALSLVGDSIVATSGQAAIAERKLQAPRGQLNLVAMAAPGEVLITAPGVVAAPEARGNVVLTNSRIFVNAGTFTIRAGTLDIDSSFVDLGATSSAAGERLDVRADTVRLQATEIDAAASAARAGGEILISARRLSATDSTLVASGRSAAAGGIRLSAESARLDNTSVLARSNGGAAAGTVRIDAGTLELVRGAQLSVSSSGDGAAGQVEVSVRDALTVRGENPAGLRSAIVANSGVLVVNGLFVGAGDAGSIDVEAGEVVLGGGTSMAADTFGPGRGGEVFVRSAGGMSLTGINGEGIGSFVSAESRDADSGGMAGRVRVHAASLDLRDGASISALSQGPGDAGRVDLVIGGPVTLDGVSARGNSTVTADSQSRAVDAGNAGSVDVRARTVSVTGGAAIGAGARGPGRAGTVAVAAERVYLGGSGRLAGLGQVAPSGVFAFSSGRVADPGGAVRIEARDLAVENGAWISTDGLGPASAGRIVLDLGGSLTLDGENQDGFGSRISASGRGPGSARSAGGLIDVRAGSVTLAGGGQISSATFGASPGGAIVVMARDAVRINPGSARGRDSRGFPSAIATVSRGAGAGGRIEVHTEELVLGRGGLISADASASGKSGDVALRAARIQLTGGARIFTDSTGSGDAGDIDIRAERTLDIVDSAIVSAARSADGGNIDIQASKWVLLRNSAISAQVGGGAGQGGNIHIDPDFVILDSSAIRADAQGGPGGNIVIVAGQFIASPDSIVDASSTSSVDGTVVIDAPGETVSRELAVLPAEFRAGVAVSLSPCAGRSGADVIELSQVRYGVLPDSPHALQSFLPSLDGERVPSAGASIPADETAGAGNVMRPTAPAPGSGHNALAGLPRLAATSPSRNGPGGDCARPVSRPSVSGGHSS